MGIEVMGRVVVQAKIENLADLTLAEYGAIKTDSIRWLEIANALVDTGASTLCLPSTLIAKLGLHEIRRRQTTTAGGKREVRIFSAVRLTVQARDCVVEVTELPDDCPVLVGQIPLEIMDWVVDPKGQRLIGNPAHGGEWMWEIF